MTKKILLTVLFSIVSFTAFAQIPYYATPLGKGTIYGYFEHGFTAGEQYQETYTYWQYGCTDWLDAGFDYDAGSGFHELGFTLKFGHTFSKWFEGGIQFTPFFSTEGKFSYERLSMPILLQGAITKNEKLFWLSNTTPTFCKDGYNIVLQNWYLGYKFDFKNEDQLTTFIGMSHDWDLNSDATPMIGLYYVHKRVGFYAWGSALTESHPYITLGIDVTF